MIFELTIYSCRKKLDTNSDYGRVVQGNSVKKSFEPRSEPNQTIEQKQCIVNPMFYTKFDPLRILIFLKTRNRRPVTNFIFVKDFKIRNSPQDNFFELRHFSLFDIFCVWTV